MEEKTNLIDQMIIKCNDAVKTLTQGQYIAFCSLMVSVVQGLATLRNIIAADGEAPDDVAKEEDADAGE